MNSKRGHLFGKRLSKKGTGQHLMSNKELLHLLKETKLIKDDDKQEHLGISGGNEKP
jgi:hypothetical protein